MVLPILKQAGVQNLKTTGIHPKALEGTRARCRHMAVLTWKI
jgi:hypothetical protein